MRVLYNIVRGFVRFFFLTAVALSCRVIKIVTFERGKKKVLTVRKARRIRALSKFKMRMFDILPACVIRFLGIEGYKIYLNQHLRDGLQLCYK